MSPKHSYAAMGASHEAIPPPYTGTASTAGEIDKSPYLHQLDTSSPTYTAGASLPPRPYKRVGFFRRHLGLWRALPCAVGAIIWATQMIYFFFYFASLPAEADGSWPRIGPSYAMYPFISCIGAIRELSFKTVSVIVAVLLWTGFGIDYVVGSRSPVGIWWRRGKLFLSSTSSVFLILLSFSSVNAHHKLHLIFTSFQIICMGMSKLCDWNLARAMRTRTPNNRFLKRSKVLKRIAAVIASPCSVLAIIGIYGCSAKFENGKVIFSPICWSLVSFAAPAEWALSWAWVIFLFSVSYDTYHLNYTVRLLLNTPAPPKKKSHGFAFWRRWTEKDTRYDEKMETWENESQGLTEAAAPLASERTMRPPGLQIQKRNEEQQPARSTPYSAGGSFREEFDEEDISGVLHDGDSELAWLPPTMPQSVFGKSGYQQVSGSPRVGEA